MDSLKINLLNPKAKELLQNLADMNIISIESSSRDAFKKVVKELRRNAKDAPTLDEITKEVEIVRSQRYGKA